MIEVKDPEDGFEVPPHLQEILFRSYLNTRSWSPPSVVAADRFRRHNNNPNCSLNFKSVIVASN